MTRQKNFPIADRLAAISALITAAGISTNEITEAMGFTSRSRTAVLMRKMVADGLAFPHGSGNVSLRYFPDAESRDAYAIAYRDEMKRRLREAWVRSSRRQRGTMDSPRIRAADAEEARQHREKASKASLKVRLKKETAAAGALVFKGGTKSAKPAKPTRSAWAELPAFNPNGIEAVELPNTLRDRFAVDEAPPLFSSLRPGQYIAPAPAWVQAVTP